MQSNEKKLMKKVQSVVAVFVVMALVLMGISIYVFGADSREGIIAIVVIAIYIIIIVIAFIHMRPELNASIVDYALEHGKIQRELLKNLAVPYAILDISGHIMWANENFNTTIGVNKDKKVRKSVDTYFPDLTPEVIGSADDVSFEIVHGGKTFSAVLKREDLSNVFLEDNVEHRDDDVVIALYLFDVTELKKYEQETRDQKLFAGLLYIDNYDEVMESGEDVKSSILTALVDRKINMYLSNIDAIVKKIENDKYFFVFRQKYMNTLRENKFSLLDDVMHMNVGNELPMTLSIGIGADDKEEGSSFIKAYSNARAAIGMALGRGGNQVAVKTGDQVTYYGGKVAETEKTTRVKARVKAQAFEELLQSKEKVLIMAHKRPDADAFGSAVGIYRLVKTLNRQAFIVLNEVTDAIRPLANSFKAAGAYDEIFIRNEQAIHLVDANTMLVICDVNRPSMTECEELIPLVPSVVVFDHHRQANEAVTKATLSYIEPAASSACEMITEMYQYISISPKLKTHEADAMYAGILIDTDNFLNKTGVRTFEAATYLRKSGADVTRVRKMFRSSMTEMKERAHGINNADIYMDVFALSYVEPDHDLEDAPTVAVAKVANELLNVDRIKASFVVTEAEDGNLYVSARSIGDTNVQIIMEKFNGGGHANIAGVQIPGMKKEEFFEKLKKILAEMYAEGEI